ncbi:MAG: hypothetical protein RBS16_09455 [Candidatus Cloacimonadales bacterium]|nr:hypothetical protein [Candidatus Cloacimonadales bacterium]
MPSKRIKTEDYSMDDMITADAVSTSQDGMYNASKMNKSSTNIRPIISKSNTEDTLTMSTEYDNMIENMHTTLTEETLITARKENNMSKSFANSSLMDNEQSSCAPVHEERGVTIRWSKQAKRAIHKGIISDSDWKAILRDLEEAIKKSNIKKQYKSKVLNIMYGEKDLHISTKLSVLFFLKEDICNILDISVSLADEICETEAGLTDSRGNKFISLHGVKTLTSYSKVADIEEFKIWLIKLSFYYDKEFRTLIEPRGSESRTTFIDCDIHSFTQDGIFCFFESIMERFSYKYIIVDKRQFIYDLAHNQRVYVPEAWKLLYLNFNKEYNIDVYKRVKNFIKNRKAKTKISILNYIIYELGMEDELFQLSLKVFDWGY